MEVVPHFDSDSEDQTKQPQDHDRDVLKEEEEREKLLTDPAFHNSDRSAVESKKARRRSRRRKKRGRRRDDEGEGETPLYKMEEGGTYDWSSTSSRSSMERDALPSKKNRVRYVPL